MVSLRVLVFPLVLTLLGVIVKSGKGSELTKLYNSKVVKAEEMVRPLGKGKTAFGPISHSGVRVTLENGHKWLIHKGFNFGRASDTVVVDAKYMSNRWKIKRTKYFYGQKTVGDFVRVGGTRYNLLTANCHQATKAMMNQKVSRRQTVQANRRGKP